MFKACVAGRENQLIKSPSSREENGVEILVKTVGTKRGAITNQMLWQILTAVAHFFLDEQNPVFWAVNFDIELDGTTVGRGRLWDTGGDSMSEGSSPPESPSVSGGSTLGSSGGSSGSIWSGGGSRG